MCLRVSVLLVCLFGAALPAAAQTFLGPTPYLSAADSPFPLASPAFVLEDFEDHLLDAPGVTALGGYVTSTHFSGGIIDSVDGDDGVVGNGTCTSCDSYFHNASLGFQFDAAVLGGLPKRVGIVWTDGGPGCTATFEAFDASGLSLGTLVAPNIGDNSTQGTTGEDRFFGLEYPGGVKEIRIANNSGGLEVDHLQFELPCGASTGSIYCTAKTNSLGCLPQIGYAGCPSASSASPFDITCTQVISNKSGLLFYGYAAGGAPFQGGFLCVQPPTRRTAIQSSGGSPPPNTCTGQFAFDMNALIQSGTDNNLVAGASVYAQYWYRDPAAASTTGLSNGLGFSVGP
jgi:hypothetical protein